MSHRGAECSLGWLPALETLLGQLRQDNDSLRDVRIGEMVVFDIGHQLNSQAVRYEQFERPNTLFRAIFGFLFDSTTSSEFLQTVSEVH